MRRRLIIAALCCLGLGWFLAGQQPIDGDEWRSAPDSERRPAHEPVAQQHGFVADEAEAGDGDSAATQAAPAFMLPDRHDSAGAFRHPAQGTPLHPAVSSRQPTIEPEPADPAERASMRDLLRLTATGQGSADDQPGPSATSAPDRPVIATGSPQLDPDAPWRDNAERINDHFHDFRQQLRATGEYNQHDWRLRHQLERISYEAQLSAEDRAALPGRGTPTAAIDQFGFILEWDVERYGGSYETRIEASGPTQGARTPVEVVTYDRGTGEVEARYPAVAFVDDDGTIEIDAIGQRVESDVWQSWSPDSFSLRPDGELRTIDDKFDGSTGTWAPNGDC